MRIVERSELDVARWDRLVAQQDGASFFSYSWYLDAVAEQWCVLVDEDYTTGMALPYTRRAGKKVLYIPVFGRYVTPIRTLSDASIQLILDEFPVREIATSHDCFPDASERVYQEVLPNEERKLSSQAKRSLKKAEKSGIQVRQSGDFSQVMSAVRSELDGKFEGVNTERIDALESLFKKAAERGFLMVFEASDSKETGGIVCLCDEHQVLYVKGACPEHLKQNGGMYAALNAAIEFAKEEELLFDFGGSNVEGVRRFNQNLGGTDVSYFFHEHAGPGWFKIARKLKKRVGR